MIIVKDNMWNHYAKVDHFIITTNAIIKGNGAVVMGAGIAKQVRDKWRHLDTPIDVQLGNAIKQRQYEMRNCGHYDENPAHYYGTIIGRKLGVFQVKNHFKDSADLELIRFSACQLARAAYDNPDKVYALNFPGIGNGKLKYDDVFPLIDYILPDNVLVFML